MAAVAAKHTFARLTPALIGSASQCVAESFAPGNTPEDPFTWLFNLRKHHWISMSSLFIERAAHSRDNLSVVALNAAGEVSGWAGGA